MTSAFKMPLQLPPEEESPAPQSRLRRLTAECPPLASYGLAVLLALAFVAYLFPLSFLAGRSGFFEQIDASSHVAGWLFFARGSWHFPLLMTERLNHPEGISIAFTDSIPFVAVLFKLFSRWLPPGFHYFGLWHAFAFVLQAVAANFLVRTLGARHVLATIAAVVFALAWPALLWRLGHPSLMTHGILLFALAFYFLARQGKWSTGRASFALTLLCAIGLTVHPYFLAFCYPLFLALLADQALAGEGWMRQVPRVLGSLAALAVVGALFGYFGHGSTTTFGYGYYSMNLTSPFCGGRFIGCTGGTSHQFDAFRFADATGGQYEGYDYFGAGLLLLIPFAIALRWRTLKSVPRRYPALLTLMLMLTLYALSTTIYAGAHQLASYSLPPVLNTLTGTFRASGRFFWMAGYLVLFSVLAALLRRAAWSSLLLVSIALALQWMDVQPLRERVQAKAATPETNDLAPWATALSDIEKINIYPAFGCADADLNVYWYFQRLAARYGKLIDTGYIARPHVDCTSNTRAFDSAFLPRQLYVMPANYLDNPFIIPAGFLAASQLGQCMQWQRAVVCRASAGTDYWKTSGLPLQAVPPLSARMQWPASKLPTLAGKLQNGRLVPGDKTQESVLSFGPYITLPAGHYRYAIEYVSDVAPSQQVGRWDVVVSNGTPAPRQLGAGSLAGTSGEIRRIEGRFDAGDWKLPLEIRTFSSGGGDLQLIGITLDKIEPSSK